MRAFWARRERRRARKAAEEADEESQSSRTQLAPASAAPASQFASAPSNAFEGDDWRRRLDFLDGQLRQRAIVLFFVGALSGLLGFLFAAFLGFWQFFFDKDVDLVGRPFPSGQNYFPQTVSEMVYDPTTPSGKCFFAFMLIGAICMLMSWYPYELRNVWIGDDTGVLCCLGGPSCVSMRQLLPPLGMMLVACIPTTPAAQAGLRDEVTVNVHTAGAIMMMGSYIGFELYALLPYARTIRISGRPERIARWVTLGLCITGALGFQICGSLIVNNTKDPLSCWDKWRVPTPEDILVASNRSSFGSVVWNSEGFTNHRARRVDSAYGRCLAIKVSNYVFEVVAGLGMIANMLVIWYFCPERKVDLDEELPDHPTSSSDSDSETKNGCCC